MPLRMDNPVPPESALAALEQCERLFEQMIEQQRVKVLKLARQAVPQISSEDVMNPNDYPELKAHPTFDYEDGILAGLISAQVAIRTELRSAIRPPEA